MPGDRLLLSKHVDLATEGRALMLALGLVLASYERMTSKDAWRRLDAATMRYLPGSSLIVSVAAAVSASACRFLVDGRGSCRTLSWLLDPGRRAFGQGGVGGAQGGRRPAGDNSRRAAEHLGIPGNGAGLLLAESAGQVELAEPVLRGGARDSDGNDWFVIEDLDACQADRTEPATVTPTVPDPGRLLTLAEFGALRGVTGKVMYPVRRTVRTRLAPGLDGMLPQPDGTHKARNGVSHLWRHDRVVRTEFLAGSFPERLALALDPRHEEPLREWLSTETLDFYRRLGRDIGRRHLGDAVNTDIIFVPGVMGSSLASQGLGGIWWFDVRSRRHLNDLRLASGGSADADPRALVEPVSVDMSYEGFLASVYASPNHRPTGFPYDWRKSLTCGAEDLAARIQTISRGIDGRPVHLVAHSMGGLLVRTTLMRHPDLWPLIGKVVFIGTPHYGSPAIAGYLKNHFWGKDVLVLLGRYLNRATFRSLRGVLSLMPAPEGIYPATRSRDSVHPCANFDMYDAGAWRLGLDETDTADLQSTLDASRCCMGSFSRHTRNLDQELRDKMLVIAGVGYKTLFHLGYRPSFGYLWQHMDRVTSRTLADPHREGDGRVPVASATLEHVGETRYVIGKHARLPSMPEVSAEVLRFIDRKPLNLARTVRAALVPHLGESSVADDDPGYLNFEAYADDHLDGLEEAISTDRVPSLHSLSIL